MEELTRLVGIDDFLVMAGPNSFVLVTLALATMVLEAVVMGL